jgi:hypothetical protein
MRQVREVLRLKHACGQSERRIAGAIGISRYTVAEYLRRAAVIGMTWPVPPDLDDAALERKLFTPPGSAISETARPQPDWARIHADLRRRDVTLLLLWEEYRAGQPEGYGYSRFCDLYAAWRGRLSPTMRQTHPPGERLFVDYAGQTVEVIDPLTGEVRAAQIFVAALGASNLTYAEARWTQGLADWLGCHVNAFTFWQRWPETRQPPWRRWKLALAEACRHGWPPQAMRPPRAGCAARAAATCAPRYALPPGPVAKDAQARWPHAGSRDAGHQAGQLR